MMLILYQKEIDLALSNSISDIIYRSAAILQKNHFSLVTSTHTFGKGKGEYP